jgi:alpha-N-arabinofuranosidase
MPTKRIIPIVVAMVLMLNQGLLAQKHSQQVNSPEEYHVAKNGSDKNTGTKEKPFLTIQAAADLAQPGNIITVHEGTYRERINPLRGGTSGENRIVYQAAPGKKVSIKGSELIKDWKKLEGDVWEVTLANAFFGDFNPYSDTIYGHWFESKGRKHHTGAVYLNGDWLDEAAASKDVMAPTGDTPLWFGKVGDKNTTILAQFPGVDPNREEVEINVRQTVFFPEKQGLNYITVRGFTMSQAATPWAPPTIEQLGLIGPHWSKGWIIENNIISHSMCVGISLGLGDVGLDVVGTGIGYTKLANYVLNKGIWTKEKIGSHVVRGNRISHCEQAGIAGSFGPAFSLIEGNEISDIHVRERFTGMEMCGIKLHAAVDVLIQNNCVYRTGYRTRGIWLDWMGQGAIIRDNLVFETGAPALYLEVNHGPILVANNIFMSETSMSNRSRGTAYVHNLFAGQCVIGNTTRTTPYMEPHSTALAGMHDNYNGDDRFYNNVFAGASINGKNTLGEEDKRSTKPGPDARYEDEKLPLKMEGNLYINGAIAHEKDLSSMVFKQETADLKVIRKEDGFYIQWKSNPVWVEDQNRKLITTEMLGKARVPDMLYEHSDGSPLMIDSDYFGKKRNKSNLNPGPFAELKEGNKIIKVWPVKDKMQ